MYDAVRVTTLEVSMTTDTLKTITISLTSSFCTALFIVACSASADKSGEPPSLTSGYDDDDDGGGYGGGSDVGGGGGDVDAATLAALELRVAELEDFRSSALCFIGHMTDDSRWDGERVGHDSYPGTWRDIRWDNYGYLEGEAFWNQGHNSDAMKAYEDCF